MDFSFVNHDFTILLNKKIDFCLKLVDFNQYTSAKINNIRATLGDSVCFDGEFLNCVKLLTFRFALRTFLTIGTISTKVKDHCYPHKKLY